MKKYAVLAAFLVLGIVLFISGCACKTEVKPETTGITETGKMAVSGDAAVEEFVYTCPMHPDVVMEKDDKCPKCGMTLKQMKKTGFKPTKPK